MTSRVTVSSVAIGKDADVQLMVDIAKWGKGRFYYTEDSQTIPRIFTLETQLASKASLVEQPFKPFIQTRIGLAFRKGRCSQHRRPFDGLAGSLRYGAQPRQAVDRLVTDIGAFVATGQIGQHRNINAGRDDYNLC